MFQIYFHSMKQMCDQTRYKFTMLDITYRKISNIRRTNSPKLDVAHPRRAVVFSQCNEARRSVENEDVVGAAPTGDAPTTSERSTILLFTKVCLKLETWRYFNTLPNILWIRYTHGIRSLHVFMAACLLRISYYFDHFNYELINHSIHAI